MGHVFVLREVNCEEVESLRFTCLTDFNTCDVIPDPKQNYHPYELACFDTYDKQ